MRRTKLACVSGCADACALEGVQDCPNLHMRPCPAPRRLDVALVELGGNGLVAHGARSQRRADMAGANMARHHYVPKFLLRQWAINGRLIAYYFQLASGKVIENTKATVASACQIPDLNTYFGVHASHRDLPETGFFTPVVDTPAAMALRVISKQGLSAFTPAQRLDWARLLVSFGVRTPEALRDMGPNETRKAFALVEASAKGPPDAERRVSEIVKKGMPMLERNFPLSIAMDLSSDLEKLEAIDRMTWWIRRWPQTAMLIGDRPLLTFPRAPHPCGIPLDHPDCLIALPIGPRAVFFASANPKTRDKVRKMMPSKIAFAVNEETIWRSTVVYAGDRSLASFIKPRIEGKATGRWQPRRR